MKRLHNESSTSALLQEAAATLARKCDALKFAAPVAFTYNPLDYAWSAHRAFLSRARMSPTVLFVGMNPGPFGMAQTGVPFGEVASVRDFLGIDERTVQIAAPKRMHPKRPIEGFACKRSEVSGARVWSWARERFGSADEFFRQAFVWNWCPLAFMSQTGANLTPDKLPCVGRGSTSVRALESACDEALAAAIDALEPKNVVGFGAFAADRARRVIDAMPPRASAAAPPRVHKVLHPSPASPAANRGWAPQVDQQLAAAGIVFGRK